MDHYRHRSLIFRLTAETKTAVVTGIVTTSLLVGCGAQPQQQQSSLPNPPTSANSPASGSASSPATSRAGSGSTSTGLPSSSGQPTGASPGGGSAGVNTGSPGTPTPAGSAGSSVGPGGEQASQPGSPSPTYTRTASGDTGTTAGNPSTSPQTDTQPPTLGQGNQRRIEDFSEQTPTGASAASAAERVGELDSALNSSISNYDGMILRERENMANRANAKGSEDDLAQEEVSGPLFDEIGSETASRSSSPEDEGPGDAYETATAGNSTPTAGGATAGRGSPSGVTPADIPSGNDDDIVARQIREAAMNEPDPQLREKLWQEYRKYKSQK